MKIITFRLFEDSYLRSYLFDEKALVLSSFLTDDVGPYGESFIRFIQDPKAQRITRNYSRLTKDGDDVLISCQFDEDPYEDCIRIPQREFVSMLNQWDKLMDQDPQEIVVFKEGDTYRLEGHGFPSKE